MFSPGLKACLSGWFLILGTVKRCLRSMILLLRSFIAFGPTGAKLIFDSSMG